MKNPDEAINKKRDEILAKRKETGKEPSIVSYIFILLFIGAVITGITLYLIGVLPDLRF